MWKISRFSPDSFQRSPVEEYVNLQTIPTRLLGPVPSHLARELPPPVAFVAVGSLAASASSLYRGNTRAALGWVTVAGVAALVGSRHLARLATRRR